MKETGQSPLCAVFDEGDLSACRKISASLRKSEHFEFAPLDPDPFAVDGQKDSVFLKGIDACDSAHRDLFLLFDRKSAFFDVFAHGKIYDSAPEIMPKKKTGRPAF